MASTEGSKAGQRRAVDQAAGDARLLLEAQRDQATREARLPWQFRDPQLAAAAWIAAEVRATMAAHREIDPALLRAAEAGELRRSNTRAGTAERSAADRVQYLRAQERGKARGLAPGRGSARHYEYETLAERVATIFAYNDQGRPQVVHLTGVSLRDEKRAGKYMGAVRALSGGRYRSVSGAYLYGDAAKRDFTRRFRSWRPIAGHRVVWRAEDALAIADAARAAGVVIEFVSPPKRRSTRSRR